MPRKPKKGHEILDDPAYVLETGPGVFMVKLKPSFTVQWKRVETEVFDRWRKFLWKERMKEHG